MEEWQHTAAFVVQFRAGTDIEAGRLEGRVEHVASTRAKRFNSLDDLLQFIAAILKELRDSNEQ